MTDVEVERVVYKYPLKFVDGGQIVGLPAQHHIVHVGLDPEGTACVWALVDPGHQPDAVTVYVVGTGQRLPPHAGTHIGSFADSPFIWHVFRAAR